MVPLLYPVLLCYIFPPLPSRLTDVTYCDLCVYVFVCVCVCVCFPLPLSLHIPLHLPLPLLPLCLVMSLSLLRVCALVCMCVRVPEQTSLGDLMEKGVPYVPLRRSAAERETKEGESERENQE